MFESAKIKKAIVAYMKPRMKEDWYIKEISTGTAKKYDGGEWKVYVEIRKRVGGDWTNGYAWVDEDDYTVKGAFHTHSWVVEEYQETKKDSISLIDQIKEVVRK